MRYYTSYFLFKHGILDLELDENNVLWEGYLELSTPIGSIQRVAKKNLHVELKDAVKSAKRQIATRVKNLQAEIEDTKNISLIPNKITI